MTTEQIETLEKNMAKWAKKQMKSHPERAAEIAKDLAGFTLLPCDCHGCKQRRLTNAQAELVAAQRERNEAHEAAWAGHND